MSEAPYKLNGCVFYEITIKLQQGYFDCKKTKILFKSYDPTHHKASSTKLTLALLQWKSTENWEESVVSLSEVVWCSFHLISLARPCSRYRKKFCGHWGYIQKQFLPSYLASSSSIMSAMLSTIPEMSDSPSLELMLDVQSFFSFVTKVQNK